VGKDKLGRDEISTNCVGKDKLGRDGIATSCVGNDGFGRDGLPTSCVGRDALGRDGLPTSCVGNDKLGKDGLPTSCVGKGKSSRDVISNSCVGKDKLSRDGISTSCVGKDKLGKDKLGKDGFRASLSTDGTTGRTLNTAGMEVATPKTGLRMGVRFSSTAGGVGVAAGIPLPKDDKAAPRLGSRRALMTGIRLSADPKLGVGASELRSGIEIPGSPTLGVCNTSGTLTICEGTGFERPLVKDPSTGFRSTRGARDVIGVGSGDKA
jgi:hypothetical protein